MKPYTKSEATLSGDGVYRYELQRWWDEAKPPAVFVMLNPSTADSALDDPTIRRCVGFSKAWGFGGLAVLNLFALRATDPRELYKHADPVGPMVSLYYGMWLAKAGIVVAAWGAHGGFRGRDMAVRLLFASYGVQVHHLGLTAAGKPKHPLYLPAETKPVLWQFTTDCSHLWTGGAKTCVHCGMTKAAFLTSGK